MSHELLPSTDEIVFSRSAVSEVPWVVSVTYGKRRELVLQMIDAVQAQGVKRMVLVNNGADWSLDNLRFMHPDLIVDIVEMGANLGSAAGYAKGIQRAMAAGAELIWLIDDDNRPRPLCLQALLAAYHRELQTTPRDRLAVLAFRPEHQADGETLASQTHAGPRANSFRGFHLLDVPKKIWRRLGLKGVREGSSDRSSVSLQEAPYSGLLFHKDIIGAIGLPNPNYVVYADDYEFTHRIVCRPGGRIVAVLGAFQDDLELSWNVRRRFDNAFAANLCGDGDFRAYYGMRNGVHYDIISRNRRPAVFWLNFIAYLFVLFVLSRWYGRSERFRLLRSAICDGVFGRLGVNERFPL